MTSSTRSATNIGSGCHNKSDTPRVRPRHKLIPPKKSVLTVKKIAKKTVQAVAHVVNMAKDGGRRVATRNEALSEL